jgi:cytochrome c-type biogenesis protein CcmH
MRAWALGDGASERSAGGAAQELADEPPPAQAISGTIHLPTANRARVARGDVMFLAARRLGGPPGPGSMLAVQKLVAEDFPMRFTLSARDAMIPGVPFEGQVSITVRVDKDGDALTRKKGDVTGRIDGVAVGTQNVVVSLATVESEDRQVASSDAVQRAMLPPGHP